MKMVLEDGPG